MLRPLHVLATSFIILVASTAGAETVLSGTMDGAALDTGSPATGSATLVLDDAQDAVAFTIAYAGLVGDETISHLHHSPPGDFGRIVLELPDGNPKHGTWDLPDAMVPELLAGNIYVVIHSTEYPGGEIAGWVSIVDTAVETTPWSTVRNLYR